MTDIITFLPLWARRTIYTLFTLASLALGTVAAWTTAAGTPLPYWHAPALAVIGYLTGALGIVALANAHGTPETFGADLDSWAEPETWDDDTAAIARARQAFRDAAVDLEPDDDAGVTGGDTP